MEILSTHPSEVPGIIKALEDGKVDGSTYSGDCACLIGTIAKIKHIDLSASISVISGIEKDGSRPAERFFMGIEKGDTPETNQFSFLAHKWATEWYTNMVKAFATPIRKLAPIHL